MPFASTGMGRKRVNGNATTDTVFFLTARCRSGEPGFIHTPFRRCLRRELSPLRLQVVLFLRGRRQSLFIADVAGKQAACLDQ